MAAISKRIAFCKQVKYPVVKHLPIETTIAEICDCINAKNVKEETQKRPIRNKCSDFRPQFKNMIMSKSHQILANRGSAMLELEFGLKTKLNHKMAVWSLNLKS